MILENTQPLTSAPQSSAIPPGIAESGVSQSAMFDSGPTYMQGGGAISVQKRSASFFDGITILDVGMISLTTLALFMSIYYTRQQIFWLRANKSMIRNELDEVKINLKSILENDYKHL
jgi:hypothetical protein